MLVLALDTTTRQGSVALARDGALVAVYAGDAETTHGERLPGDVLKVLAALKRAPRGRRDSTTVAIRTQWLPGNGASGEL